MDSKRLAEIRARVEAATKGPWVWGQDTHTVDPYDLQVLDGASIVWPTAEGLLAFHRPADRAFLEHARQDIPDLLAEVERLREAIADHWQHADGNVVYCVFCGNSFAHEPDCVVPSVVPTEVSNNE